ncbi:MAG: antibiotic biosynthesis monooxygenase [Deltaproteobacteria bacterium]|nr:antibiotic biosynthesis monooxygenase [Deltaproteobacteria bacterium]
MIAVIAQMKVVDGKAEQFETIMKQLQKRVRDEEPDCLQYDICRAREPNAYFMIERYIDKQALKTHSSTEYFKEGSVKLQEVMAGAPQIDVLTIVD